MTIPYPAKTTITNGPTETPITLEITLGNAISDLPSIILVIYGIFLARSLLSCETVVHGDDHVYLLWRLSGDVMSVCILRSIPRLTIKVKHRLRDTFWSSD